MAVPFMTWPEHQLFLFSRELELLRSYLQTTSDSLNRLYQELQDRVGNATSGLEYQDAQDVHQSFTHEVFQLSVDFPRIYTTTSFVALYTLLEHQLDILCRMRQKECNYSIAIDDLKDKGIDAAKNYLVKVCGVSFPSETKEWQQIKDYQRLRNVIVHARGKLRPKDDTLRAFLARHKPDTVNAWGDISLTNNFCVDVTRVLETFMEQVTSAIPTQLTCHELSTPR